MKNMKTLVALFLIPVHVESFSTSYLDSLSTSAPKVDTSNQSYLDTLDISAHRADITINNGDSHDNAQGLLTSLHPSSYPQWSFSTPDLDEVAAATPDDHYAKINPGAGWAGYKHPMFGGYLDALSSSDQGEVEIKTGLLGGKDYLDTLKENTWEDGKKADYGDDIRWGAQVYLDAI